MDSLGKSPEELEALAKDIALTRSNMVISDQIIYRLATLEATMKGSIQLVNDKLDRMQKDMSEQRAQMSHDIGEMRGRVEILENWQTKITTRVATVGSIAFGLWALFGDAVKHLLGIPS